MTADRRQSSLLPFRGLRFTSDLDGGLGGTLGPPADIDSSEAARAFVAGHPFNAVRLEIEDDVGALRFQTGRELLCRWRRDDVLTAEPHPSYYVYEQAFDDHGEWRARRGILGLVPVDAPDVCVLPHEETWEENRQRRLQLLRDLRSSISPVFLIYDGREATGLLATIASGTPVQDVTDAFGQRHRLWTVSDPAVVEQLQAVMSDRHFVIADGHHRFAAAQIFHQEDGSPETALALACCVEAHDPGIVIRPIHRLVTPPAGFRIEKLLDSLGDWFDIEEQPIGSLDGLTLACSLPKGDPPAIGLVLDAGRRSVRLRLRDWASVEPLLPANISETARRLDVTIVTEVLVRHVLGIEPDADLEHVAYINDPTEALTATRREPYPLAILIRPIQLEQVMAVARANGTVPAKSTSFVPKIPIGLVMHEFGDRDGEARRGAAGDTSRRQHVLR